MAVTVVGTLLTKPSSQASCPPAAATHLDLSHNLLWRSNTLARLIQQLPSLTTLDLSYNRLATPLTSPPANQLRVLVLNSTFLPWEDVLHVAGHLSQLEELHACGNRIRNLQHGMLAASLPRLRVLDLDDNDLCDWAQVAATVQQLPHLTRLQLNGNAVQQVTSPPGACAEDT